MRAASLVGYVGKKVNSLTNDDHNEKTKAATIFLCIYLYIGRVIRWQNILWQIIKQQRLNHTNLHPPASEAGKN